LRDFSLDAEKRELRHGPELVAVEPQVFDLLQYLIVNRDRVVSKDDLINAVRGGRVVSDSAISSRITAVWQAIGVPDHRFDAKTQRGARCVSSARRDLRGGGRGSNPRSYRCHPYTCVKRV